jgi:outer membrane protein TolC
MACWTTEQYGAILAKPRDRMLNMGRKRNPRWSAVWSMVFIISDPHLAAQSAPASPARPWVSGTAGQMKSGLNGRNGPGKLRQDLEAGRVYSLAELVAFAEAHNPQTRAAWENAQAQASAIGIARSVLLPQLAVIASATVARSEIPSGERFYRQTVPGFETGLDLQYLIFDGGARHARIDQSTARLLAANFDFNDVHRGLIFDVEQLYFRLLDAFGQEAAARASLANAQAVRQAAELRLQNGLATLPDVLQSRSAAAQAEYDLVSVLGRREIAMGDLATSLGLAADISIPVQPLDQLEIPRSRDETVRMAMERALAQRPDLQAKLAAASEASARENEARAAYWPTLSALASTNGQSLFVQQQDLPLGHTTDLTGGFQLNLRWTVFDGGSRRNRLAEAAAEVRRAEADVNASRDQVENQVWMAYSLLQTAFRQRDAAAELLAAASQSYAAALESYNYGLRNLLDVTAAQQVLSQARSSDVSARTGVLAALSNLAYRTASSIQTGQTHRP